ncbi:MAG: DUF1593 domain-containing protein [Mediterranea sp.]|nr:DUF1593 domain-containing protein [Mediterranea sp.]
MNRHLLRALLMLLLPATFACSTQVQNRDTQPSADELKPRLVVCTDIAPGDVEPDDMESAVRLLAYADRLEIEAIITTVGWNCDPYPTEWDDYLRQVIDGYAHDIPHLMKRSGQEAFLPLDEENGRQTLGYWPSADYLRGRALMGSTRAGIGVIGEGNDSPGSDFLIRLADEEDERPIWVAAWGSANTLAQAVWRVQQTRTPEQLKAFLQKFRVYTITDQDMVYAMREDRAYSAHQWLRRDFKDDLRFIWDEGTWQTQCSLGVQNWNRHVEQIQQRGALGALYPNYKYGVEGDTPSFLHILPTGLNDPDQPTQVGWGGVHTFALTPDSLTYAWTSWEEPWKSMTEAYKTRFYPDEFNDFAARMQWAAEGKGNTNPQVVVNGTGGTAPLCLTVKAGSWLELDAGRSVDAEGDELTFRWWRQPEADSYPGELEIAEPTASAVRIRIPAEAAGKSLHLICEVHDRGPFTLVAYRRIQVTVE